MTTSTSATSPATVLDGLDAVRAAEGDDLGTSEWILVDQGRVDAFADAVGLPRTETRFAHGELTLSLTNGLLPEIVEVRGVSMGLNYGTNRVRFPSAVTVGSRVRAHARLTDVADVEGGVQTTMTVTVEAEGSEKPACIVEVLSRFLE